MLEVGLVDFLEVFLHHSVPSRWNVETGDLK